VRPLTTEGLTAHCAARFRIWDTPDHPDAPGPALASRLSLVHERGMLKSARSPRRAVWEQSMWERRSKIAAERPFDDHLRDLLESLSPVWAEVASMRGRGSEADLFCGLFARVEATAFTIGKWAWSELVQKKLELILDLYPPFRDGEGPKRSSAELIAEGPLERLAVASTLAPELPPERHVEEVARRGLSRASLDPLSSMRIRCRFASPEGQGSLLFEEPLMGILAQLGAEVQVILCGPDA